MRATRNPMEVVLHLDAKEALWLKRVMQNPVGPECSEDYKHRELLFNTLPDLEVLEEEVTHHASI